MYKPKPNGNYHTDIVLDIFCGSGGFTARDTGYKNVVRLKENELILLQSKQNTMAEKMDVLTQAFSRFLTGFCLSKAILEDYAKVVAKLENVPEQEITNRVKKRCDEIFEEVKAKQIQETEAAEN